MQRFINYFFWGAVIIMTISSSGCGGSSGSTTSYYHGYYDSYSSWDNDYDDDRREGLGELIKDRRPEATPVSRPSMGRPSGGGGGRR